jgi:hypothetical protein
MFLYYTTNYNIQCPCMTPTQCIYVFGVILTKPSITSHNDINGLVFVTATEYVSCETGNGILHKSLFILISYCKSFNMTEILQLIT